MVKASTFGGEFVVYYKLHMMGILINGPTNVFCDNELVFKSATRSKATLKKKHNAVAHHRTREAVAAGIVCIAWEDERFNLADILTALRTLIAHSHQLHSGSDPKSRTQGADPNLAWLGLNQGD